MNSRYVHGVDSAAEGTCSWLSHEEKYSAWIKEGGLLWIEGKAGSGKSTLMKFAMEQERARLQSSPNASTLQFFFNGRGNLDEKSPLGLFRTLVHDLLNSRRNDPHISQLISAGLKECRTSHGQLISWHIDALKSIFLRACSAASGQIIVFLDGLDEMEIHNDMTHLSILLFFLRVAESGPPGIPKLRLCFSSRELIPVKNWWRTHPYPHLYLQDENESDIRRYVRNRTEDLRQECQLAIDLDYIGQWIMMKADGVFLWVVLVMKEITEQSAEFSCATRGELMKRLADIPQELVGLYRRMLGHVKDQNKLKTLQMMLLVLFASRPLRLKDFRMAISAIHGPVLLSFAEMDSHPDIVQDDSRMADRIQNFTGGLLEIGSPTGKPYDREAVSGNCVVQVIHQSVLDFCFDHGGLLALIPGNLVPGSQLDIKDVVRCGHMQLLDACLNLISMAANSNNAMKEMPSHVKSAKGMENPPFWDYAVNEWPFHTKQCAVDRQHYVVDRFLADDGKDFAYLQQHGGPKFDELQKYQCNMLYVFAQHKLYFCVAYLIDKYSFDVNSSGGPLGSPLGAVILQPKPRDSYKGSWMGYTPDDETTINVLRQRGARLDRLGDQEISLLQIAAYNYDVSAFKKLIELGANTRECGGPYGHIVYAAISNSWEAENNLGFLSALLDDWTELIFVKVDGESPLAAAARDQYPRVFLTVLHKIRELDSCHRIDFAEVFRNSVFKACLGHDTFPSTLLMGVVLRELGEQAPCDQIKAISEEALAYTEDQAEAYLTCGVANRKAMHSWHRCQEIKRKGEILQEYLGDIATFTLVPPPGRLRQAVLEETRVHAYFLLMRYDYSLAMDDLDEAIDELATQDPSFKANFEGMYSTYTHISSRLVFSQPASLS